MGFETFLLLCDVLRRPGRFGLLVCVLCLLIYRGVALPGGRRETGAGPGHGFSVIGSETQVLALAPALAPGRAFLC